MSDITVCGWRSARRYEFDAKKFLQFMPKKAMQAIFKKTAQSAVGKAVIRSFMIKKHEIEAFLGRLTILTRLFVLGVVFEASVECLNEFLSVKPDKAEISPKISFCSENCEDPVENSVDKSVEIGA